MSDFLPSDMTTIYIPAGEYFELNFDTMLLDTYVRGAFFTVGSKESSSIDVFIVGPKQKKIMQFLSEDEGIIRFNTGRFGPGIYTCVFSNKQNSAG